MPIALTDKIVALLCSLTDEQIEALPPAERRRLEHICMQVMVRCAPLQSIAPKLKGVVKQPMCECDFEPRSGILDSLQRGDRDE